MTGSPDSSRGCFRRHEPKNLALSIKMLKFYFFATNFLKFVLNSRSNSVHCSFVKNTYQNVWGNLVTIENSIWQIVAPGRARGHVKAPGTVRFLGLGT